MNKLKLLVVFEAVIIIILILTISYKNKADMNSKFLGKIKDGLLSLRIYSGLLQPKSLLIENFNPLKEVIEDKITKRNPNISVYIVNLRDGASIGINERVGFLSASLNKIPIAILIMKRVERGELSLDTMLKIKDNDRTSSFGDLYKTKEEKMQLRVLLEKMIKDSDNTAFRVLQRNIQLKDWQFLENYLDYYSNDIILDNSINFSVEDEPTNTKSIYNLFSSLYLSTLLEPENSEYILSLMTNITVFDIKKLANLPEDVAVAQKFGIKEDNGERYFHDCGIIYINQSRIFYCIMTKGLSEEQAVNTIGSIVYVTYDYVVKTRQNLDFIETQIQQDQSYCSNG
ncbi:serine hydrolase [Candidatus Woesearchaeota archaeon]|nr:serine hydrolase [Candidatus Woesearchaeota archaeon]